MIANIFDHRILRVISFFVISPGSKYTRNEIKKKTQMNNAPLDNMLSRLIALGIIKKDNSLYFLNQESESFIEIIDKIKKEYNQIHVPYKIYNILLEISNKLQEIKDIKSVILFGSYAKLIYTENSDIDIAVIMRKKIKNRIVIQKKSEELAQKISKKNKKRIELHFFMQDDLKSGKSDPLIKDILRNGKVLF